MRLLVLGTGVMAKNQLAHFMNIDGADHFHAIDGKEVGNLVFGHDACAENE